MFETFESNPALHAIIDSTEFYIHKPLLLSSQRRNRSSYKARNTIKLFISISSTTHQFYFIEALDPGSQVMAEKGFNIQDLLPLQHVHMIVPPLMCKGNVAANATTRGVQQKCIYVESIIRSLKSFGIINGVVPQV